MVKEESIQTSGKNDKYISWILAPGKLLALLGATILIAELIAINIVHLATHEHPYSQMNDFMQQSLLNVFILFALLFPVLYFIIYRPLINNLEFRNKTEKKLIQLVKDKEMLVREVYHRVKNNLIVVQSLLRLQSNHIKDHKAREYFDESTNRVKSLSMIHERLYKAEDLQRINMPEYVNSLARSLFSSYKVNSDNVELKIDIHKISLDEDTMIQCGLIINELTSNALKHAFSNQKGEKLTIRMFQEGNKKVLLIKDNGCGIPEDIDIFNTASMGMQIIITSINQIGGTVEISRNKGTEFRIIFESDSKTAA
jgi:two-component sensor histidine kinase